MQVATTEGDITRIELGGKSAKISLAIILSFFFIGCTSLIVLGGNWQFFVGFSIFIASACYFIFKSIAEPFDQVIEVSPTTLRLFKKDVVLWEMPWVEFDRLRYGRRNLEIIDKEGRIYALSCANIGPKDNSAFLAHFPTGAILEAEKIELSIYKLKVSKTIACAILVIGVFLGIYGLKLLSKYSAVAMANSDLDPTDLSPVLVLSRCIPLIISAILIPIGLAHILPKNILVDNQDYPVHRLDRYLLHKGSLGPSNGSSKWTLLKQNKSYRNSGIGIACCLAIWASVLIAMIASGVKGVQLSGTLFLYGMYLLVVGLHVFALLAWHKEVDPNGWAIFVKDGEIVGTDPEGGEVKMNYKRHALRFSWRGKNRTLSPKDFYFDPQWPPE